MNIAMRIIIADDHPILREGLIRNISVEPDFEIVGETGDGKKALELIRDLSPELAVLDISMPGMTGLEIVRKCQQENLQTHSFWQVLNLPCCLRSTI